MVRDELLRLRASAEAEAATLARDLEALFAASRDSNADDEHDPEGATIAFERQQVQALLDQALASVAAAQEALTRRDAGAYGVCERCGRPIGEERLAARPTATLCIDCATGRGRRPSTPG